MEIIKKIELILHIGAGKTGTSSIQETLRNNSLALNDQHVKYLGLMLEFAEHKYDYSKLPKKN